PRPRSRPGSSRGPRGGRGRRAPAPESGPAGVASRGGPGSEGSDGPPGVGTSASTRGKMDMFKTGMHKANVAVEGLEGRNLTAALSAQSLAVVAVTLPAAQTGGSGPVIFNPNPEDPGEPRGPLGPVSRGGLIGFGK